MTETDTKTQTTEGGHQRGARGCFFMWGLILRMGLISYTKITTKRAGKGNYVSLLKAWGGGRHFYMAQRERENTNAANLNYTPLFGREIVRGVTDQGNAENPLPSKKSEMAALKDYALAIKQ